MYTLEEIARAAAKLPVLDRLRLLRLLATGVESEMFGQQIGAIATAPNDAPPAVKELEDLTYRVIGCAMALHRQLGPGLSEINYQRGMEDQLTAAGIMFTAQQVLEVYTNGPRRAFVGYYIPDFLIERRLVLEIKALGGLSNDHLAQTICYLAATGCAVGLLINFGKRSLDWRRVLPPRNIDRYRINRQWLYVPEGYTLEAVSDSPDQQG
jgi:GxxExxY protein